MFYKVRHALQRGYPSAHVKQVGSFIIIHKFNPRVLGLQNVAAYKEK